MRKIVLSVETTGVSSNDGHRIIELAAIEIKGAEITEQRIHHFFNPEREVDSGAAAVHGLTLIELKNEPLFDIFAQEIADFIRDAELIIHNAPFNLTFLNSEFVRAGLLPVESICTKVTDTLLLARMRYPSEKNDLDSLCKRFAIDYSNRSSYGALLDTEMLAEVYLKMYQQVLH